MANKPLRIVVADDEELNLEILMRTIRGAGYKAQGFDDGDKALDYIKSNPGSVDIVILDKMMPNMSGLTVLKHIKADPALKNIPVILQTGDVGINQLKEGLDAGAYYYLSKPFYSEMLLSLINASARDCIGNQNISSPLDEEKLINNFLKYGVFEIRTIEDAHKLAAAFASYALRPDDVRRAISELAVNAIEHGTLNIGYVEKGHFLQTRTLNNEITRRLALPENANKVVKVFFKRIGNKIDILIEDQGNGFSWAKYMNYDPIRLTDLNGRGIASANIMNLGIEYLGTGNQVKITFETKSSNHQKN